MAVRVRVATELDYPVAGEVCVSAYREDGQLAGDYEMTLRDVASRAEHGRILVAVDESDEVLGCVTFVLAGQRYAELSSPGEAEFRMLAVDPSAQGQGVGGALVQACIDTAEQQELDGLVICVRDFNVNAQRLYARYGFRRVPEKDWSPLPGVELLAMRLDLPVRHPASV
jgi:ribosomal protein S18 acetylase RimI-like enzyme